MEVLGIDEPVNICEYVEGLIEGLWDGVDVGKMELLWKVSMDNERPERMTC